MTDTCIHNKIELLLESITPLDSLWVSPAALPDRIGPNLLGYTPKIAQVGNDLTIRLGRLDDAEWAASADEQTVNPRRHIHEVIHLRRRGLVIIDTAEELFVLTEAEYKH